MFKKKKGVVKRVRRRRRRSDLIVVFCTVFLVVVGLVMLASASSNLGKIRFDDTYHYLKHQLMFGVTFGLIGFFLASKIYYRFYEKIAVILILVGLGLLLLVYTPFGLQTGGAERWLQLGPVSFQPAEFMNIAMIIYLAAWLRKKERTKKIMKGLVPFLIVVGLTTYLLLKQPSTSSAAILLAVSLIIYFASGTKFSHVLAIILIGTIAFSSAIYFSPYRWERVQSFLNPEANQLSSGYHINQTLIAIGSGGLWGVGYGQSTTKIRNLPEPIGDSIFAVIAEEMGFVGTGVLLAIFLLLILRTFQIAARAKDKFGHLLLVGFGSLIAIQAFVNIAAVSGVIPLTGAPLPFISYGGTALVSFMTIAGIINNVSKYN
jgi:cell division protein FtsW